MEKKSYLELNLRIVAPPDVIGKVKDVLLDNFDCEPQANGSDLLFINEEKEQMKMGKIIEG